jgi:hypothetical protein
LHSTAAWTSARTPKLTSSHAAIAGGRKAQPALDRRLLQHSRRWSCDGRKRSEGPAARAKACAACGRASRAHAVSGSAGAGRVQRHRPTARAGGTVQAIGGLECVSGGWGGDYIAASQEELAAVDDAVHFKYASASSVAQRGVGVVVGTSGEEGVSAPRQLSVPPMVTCVPCRTGGMHQKIERVHVRMSVTHVHAFARAVSSRHNVQGWCARARALLDAGVGAEHGHQDKQACLVLDET